MNHRRSARRQVADALQVVDSISGQPLGRIGDLSADGMLLVGQRTLAEQHVWQVRFPLPGHGEHRIEVGIQCLWSVPATGEHHQFSGFHFISISPQDQELLDAWVAQDAAKS